MRSIYSSVGLPWWERPSKTCGHQLTRGTWRLLAPFPVLGTWLPLACLAPRGHSLEMMWCGERPHGVCDETPRRPLYKPCRFAKRVQESIHLAATRDKPRTGVPLLIKTASHHPGIMTASFFSLSLPSEYRGQFPIAPGKPPGGLRTHTHPPCWALDGAHLSPLCHMGLPA